MTRNIVVTGGAGFIGANFCRGVSARIPRARITVVDDLSSGLVGNLAGVKGVELVEGSILDPRLLNEVVADADTVVHLAARPSVQRSLESPLETHEANATGTLRVLEAARNADCPHVVVASSSSVYGANRALPADEAGAVMPLSPYAASKLAGESYALSHARCFGLPVLVFRFFNVFGPLQRADHPYAAVVPSFVRAALDGEPLTVHGDGNQTRDFTFVGSVVSLLVASVEQKVTSPGPVNLAFGGRNSILEVVAMLERILGRTLERRHGPPRSGDVRDSQANRRRLTELFPDATPVSLEEGLRATVEWFETGEVGRRSSARLSDPVR